MSMLEKSPEDRPATALDVAERLSQIRMSPQRVESSSAHVRHRTLPEEALDALKPTVTAFNGSLRCVGIALATALLILAAVWTAALLRPDAGTSLWIRTMHEHPETAVRVSAAQAVGELANGNRKLLETLMTVGEDTSAVAEVRVEALRQLMKHPVRANKFRSRLNKLAKNDPMDSVRLQAAATLAALKT